MKKLLLLVVVVAGLAYAPAANAESICVDPYPGAGCDQTPADLAIALAYADSNGEGDTIFLGEADYEFGGTAYNSFEPLTIQGLGIAQSVITRPIGDTNGTTLEFGLGAVTLRNLAVEVSTTNILNPGILSSSGSLTLEQMAVADNGISAAIGIASYGSLTMRNAAIDLGSPTSNTCILTDGSALIENMSVVNCSTGINHVGTLGLTANAVAISDFGGYGLRTAYGTNTINNSLIQVSSIGSKGIETGAGGAGAEPTTIVNQSTIVNTSPGTASGIGSFNYAATVPTHLRVTDSIVSGFGANAFLCDSNGPARPIETSLDHVAYGSFTSIGATACAAPTEVAPFPDTPDFVVPGSDFRLSASSPLVNADPNTVFASGEPQIDYFGNPRIQDCKRDLGFSERPGSPLSSCVVPQPPVSPPAVAAAITGSLKFTPKSVKRKKKGKVAYTLSAPVSVTFTATPKKKGKKKPKAVKLGTQAGKAGANTFAFKTNKLKAGKYTFSATPAGGAPKTASLTIKK